VRHAVELGVALLDACRPAEVVEGDGRVPALGEAQCELLVEAIEAADVRKDHDARRPRLVGHGGEGREAVAVRRVEHEVVVRHGGARDDRDRRQGVAVEAHAESLPARPGRRPAARA